MKKLLGIAIFLTAFAISLGAKAQSLSAAPASLYQLQSTTATWSGIAAPTSLDWIGLYPVGAADNQFVAFRYTDGTAAGSAALEVPITAPAGNYELRLFSNNVYILLATSNSFTVQ